MKDSGVVQAVLRPFRWTLDRPRRVAWTYICSVPIFAVIFLSMGQGNFAQSSLENEPGNFRSQRQALVDTVGNSLFDVLPDDWYQFDDRYSTQPKAATVLDPLVSRGHVTFSLTGPVYDFSGPLDEPLRAAYLPEGFAVSIDIDSEPYFVEGFPAVFHRMRIEDPVVFANEIPESPTVRLSAGIDTFISALAEYSVDGVPVDGEVASPSSLFLQLPMTFDEEERFQAAYGAIANGDPLAAGSLYRQMGRTGYLSAVTITTLGFGDVIPVSDVSRFAVAAEAVWGVLLAGAFFYSLGIGGRMSVGNEPQEGRRGRIRAR